MISLDGRDVLEERRQGVLEWLDYAVRDGEAVAGLLRHMRSLPTRKAIARELLESLEGSDDPEFWEAIMDLALEGHPDRSRLLGRLMSGADDQDVATANVHVAEQPLWTEEGGGWQIVDRSEPYIPYFEPR